MSYKRRLEFCKQKISETTNEEKERWVYAAQVYLHMMECPLSHSSVVEGEKCRSAELEETRLRKFKRRLMKCSKC